MLASTRPILRRFALVAAALFIPLSALGASGASADASGCTLAPGGLGAINCVYVWGAGTFVNEMESVYNTGVVSYSNVCNPEAWFKFNPNNAGLTTIYRSSSNCSVVRAWLTYNPYRAMDDNSPACTKQKNTFSGSWSNYACITVHS